MSRCLSALVLALSIPVLGQVRYQPAGSVRLAVDCDTASCSAVNQVCVENAGGKGELYTCDVTAGFFRSATNQAQLIRVCKTECRYSTVGSALAAITDASSVKRYVITVGPGDYDENFTMKSYVSLWGSGPQTTRIRGDGTQTQTISFAVSVTEVGLYNLTVGGNIPLNFTSGVTSIRATTFIENCVLGIIDGTENAFKSIDGIRHVDVVSTGSRDFYVRSTLFRTTFDAVRLGRNVHYEGLGNSFYGDQSGGANVLRFWSTEGPGVELYETGFSAIMKTADTINSVIAGEAAWASGTTNRAARLVFQDGSIDIETTNSARTADTTCFELGSQPAQAAASEFTIKSVRCSVVAAGTSANVRGLIVPTDADHAQWAVRWLGGKIALSGGASPADVQNDETVSGFSLKLSGLEHTGIYSGAGIAKISRVENDDVPGIQSGSQTFSAAVSAAVTLPVAEADASYLVQTVCSDAVVPWVTSKTTTGFTINTSSELTGSCDWRLSR